MNMRIATVVVAAAVLLGQPAFGSKPGGEFADGSSCGRHGTNVEFLDSPSAAARKALAEEKLVFVLHVSGHFEDPRFT